MDRKIFTAILFSLLIMSLVSCGPSEEEMAAMTQAAASPTPQPTPTATPVPYDLSFEVVNADGEPVSGAKISLDVGNMPNPEQTSDLAGAASWVNLPAEAVSYQVSAAGYFPLDGNVALVRGPNELTAALEVDPNGLLPENACAPGETLIMVEDMQDQEMQPGWSGLSDRLASGVPFIEIAEDPSQPGNKVLKHYISDELGHYNILRYDESIGDAVVRFKVRINVGQHIQIGWHDSEDGRYIAFIYANDARGGDVEKHTPSSSFKAFNIRVNLPDEEWHLIEIATFEGTYSLWIDSEEKGSWQDKQPLGPGAFFIDALYIWEPDRTTEFDNFSVCELTAPFTSILTE